MSANFLCSHRKMPIVKMHGNPAAIRQIFSDLHLPPFPLFAAVTPLQLALNMV